MTRFIIENQFRFGQFDDATTSSSHTSLTPAPPPLDEDHLIDTGVPASARGDRLSPISRQREPIEPAMRAPSHRRSLEGPTTPRTEPAPTPHRREQAVEPPRHERLVPIRPSGKNEPRQRNIGPHDFAHSIVPPPAAPSAKGEIGPHDFAKGLTPRRALPSVGVPPHAQRALGRTGRGIAAVMHRAATPAPSTNAVAPAMAAPRGRAFTRHVYEAARRAGIPEMQARLAAAQAAHETDYGRRAPGHNYFGVKGSGTAGSQMLRTHEQGRRGLYATRGRFARYAKPEDSLAHWWAKIQRQWPQAAVASDFDEAVKGLRAGRRGGYATDMRYNEKIRRIAAGLPRPSASGASPKAVAGGATPQGPVPPTSTTGRLP